MLAAAALLAAVAAAPLLLRRETPVRARAVEPLPAQTIDLRETDTRMFLSFLIQQGRVRGLPPRRSLFFDCWTNRGDTYAVSLVYDLEPASYLEIRRNGVSPEATALYWREYDFPPGKSPPDPSRGRNPVSATDFAAIEAGFLALMHDRVEAVREFGTLHSDRVVLEFCRHGNYGVFARTRSLNAQDERLIALAMQMRAAAGLPLDEPDSSRGQRLR